MQALRRRDGAALGALLQAHLRTKTEHVMHSLLSQEAADGAAGAFGGRVEVLRPQLAGRGRSQTQAASRSEPSSRSRQENSVSRGSSSCASSARSRQ